MNIDKEPFDGLHGKVNHREPFTAREGEPLLDYAERLRACVTDLRGKLITQNPDPEALDKAEALFNEVL